jgi:hypothetical protein
VDQDGRRVPGTGVNEFTGLGVEHRADGGGAFGTGQPRSGSGDHPRTRGLALLDTRCPGYYGVPGASGLHWRVTQPVILLRWRADPYRSG